jgi:outer membrane protein assembly factor BamB
MLDYPARRSVLRRLAVVGSVGLAGCSAEDATPTTSTPSDTPTDSPTPSPTAEQPSETDTSDQPCPDPTDLPVQWRRETGDRNFDPVVADGTVYLGSGPTGGYLRAVSLADGTDSLKTRADGMIYAPPTLGPDTVYYTGHEHVAAFRRDDGTERWRHETTGNLPVPATADDGLVCFGESNHPTPQTTVDDQFDRVVALDSDGEVRWRTRYAPTDRAPVETAPVIVDETVLVGTADSTVRAFDRDDGALLWTSEVAEPRDAVVVDAGGTGAVAFASRGGVETLAVDDGRTLWRDRIGVDRIAVDGDRAFAASGEELRSLDASDGTLAWSRSAFTGRLVGLAAADDRLVGSLRSDDGRLCVAVLAPDTGCVTRSFETGGRWLSPPALGTELAVAATGYEDRSIYALPAGER